MKIVVDDKIPYIEGALEPFSEVVYCPGSKTTAELVKDADVIITRTRTICNEQLLKGSTVKLITTATIGFDHIDTAYCEANGIEWTNSPGCNSWSVAQYMMSVLFNLAQSKKLNLSVLTIGIIGAGMVGAKVEKLCKILGMKVLVNDPPRQRAEGNTGFVSLETIQQQADIVTVHTPLTRNGIDKTFHLLDDAFIAKCAKPIVLVNAARGEITDTQALINGLKTGKITDVVLDCWENEPNINLELLRMAYIATPHIAGYSRDGKANGTSMCVQAISRKFGLGIDNWTCPNVELPENTEIFIDGTDLAEQEIVGQAVLATYQILDDSERLKQSVETFEKQRGDYPVRREFPTYHIFVSHVAEPVVQKLKLMGFAVNQK